MGILSREAEYEYFPWSGKYGYPTSGHNTYSKPLILMQRFKYITHHIALNEVQYLYIISANSFE